MAILPGKSCRCCLRVSKWKIFGSAASWCLVQHKKSVLVRYNASCMSNSPENPQDFPRATPCVVPFLTLAALGPYLRRGERCK